MSKLTTTATYVSVLRGGHNRWRVAYRAGSMIVHHALANGTADEARAEAEALFGPEVAVWVPSSGEPMPTALRLVG